MSGEFCEHTVLHVRPLRPRSPEELNKRTRTSVWPALWSTQHGQAAINRAASPAASAGGGGGTRQLRRGGHPARRCSQRSRTLSLICFLRPKAFAAGDTWPGGEVGRPRRGQREPGRRRRQSAGPAACTASWWCSGGALIAATRRSASGGAPKRRVNALALFRSNCELIWSAREGPQRPSRAPPADAADTCQLCALPSLAEAARPPSSPSVRQSSKATPNRLCCCSTWEARYRGSGRSQVGWSARQCRLQCATRPLGLQVCATAQILGTLLNAVRPGPLVHASPAAPPPTAAPLCRRRQGGGGFAQHGSRAAALVRLCNWNSIRRHLYCAQLLGHPGRVRAVCRRLRSLSRAACSPATPNSRLAPSQQPARCRGVAQRRRPPPPPATAVVGGLRAAAPHGSAAQQAAQSGCSKTGGAEG